MMQRMPGELLLAVAVLDRVVNNQAKLLSSQMWPLLTSGLEYIGIAIPK
jgi:hypothetical protein